MRGAPVPPPRAPGTDLLLLEVADYVLGYTVSSKEAIKTARYAILDSVGAWPVLPRAVSKPPAPPPNYHCILICVFS